MQHVCGFRPGAESMGRGCVLTRAPLCISRVGMCLCCTSYRAVCSHVRVVSVHTRASVHTADVGEAGVSGMGQGMMVC